MSKDEFAKFLFEIGLSLKNYNFDVCIDMHTIIAQEKIDTEPEKHKVLCPSFEPTTRRMTLFVRETGTNLRLGTKDTDMLDIDADYYKQMILESHSIYEFTFCWNFSYSHGKEYVIVNKIL